MCWMRFSCLFIFFPTHWLAYFQMTRRVSRHYHSTKVKHVCLIGSLKQREQLPHSQAWNEEMFHFFSCVCSMALMSLEGRINKVLKLNWNSFGWYLLLHSQQTGGDLHNKGQVSQGGTREILIKFCIILLKCKNPFYWNKKRRRVENTVCHG